MSELLDRLMARERSIAAGKAPRAIRTPRVESEKAHRMSGLNHPPTYAAKETS